MSNKKIVAIGLISAVLLGVLSGCSFNTNKKQIEKSKDVIKKEETNDEETTQIENEGNKTLVVYYSATGSTEEVANIIAESINSDIFKLEPVKPYSDEDLNWTNDNSRVMKEHDNIESRNVELIDTKVDNWDSYDTIFIGYPIWWGIAAWPVNEFIKENDFTGKIVIPFCTSTSSGIGESGKLLEDITGTGRWLEGKRFRSGASEKEVQDWIENLRK